MRFIPVYLIALIIILGIVLSNAGYDYMFIGYVRSLPYGDKAGHFLLFGALAFFLNIAWRYKPLILWQGHINPFTHRISIWLPLGSVYVLSFAIIEELTQFFFPSRTLDIQDIWADFLGVTTFTLLNYLILFVYKRKPQKPHADSKNIIK